MASREQLLGAPCSVSLLDPFISRSDVTEIPVCGLTSGLNLECFR